LIKKDLIAFDGTIFQVLQLPAKPSLGSGSKPAAMALVEQLAKQVGQEV